MTHIYETPNKQYRIYKQNDSMWLDIFTIDGIVPVNFYIAKYEPTLAAWNKNNADAHLSDYIIMQVEQHLPDCFRWLCRLHIISKDEAEYQIKKFSEISSILPLTNSK